MPETTSLTNSEWDWWLLVVTGGDWWPVVTGAGNSGQLCVVSYILQKTEIF
jgi:hypothetical protein